MSKVGVVSYNKIMGVKPGRVEVGNVIAYSGLWASGIYQKLAFMAAVAGIHPDNPYFNFETMKNQHQDAEDALLEVQQMLQQDINDIDEFYVYVGISALDGAKALIKSLASQGKKVHMVACDCDQKGKEEFAAGLGIDIIWTTGCGGYRTCGDIIKENSGV